MNASAQGLPDLSITSAKWQMRSGETSVYCIEIRSHCERAPQPPHTLFCLSTSHFEDSLNHARCKNSDIPFPSVTKSTPMCSHRSYQSWPLVHSSHPPQNNMSKGIRRLRIAQPRCDGCFLLFALLRGRCRGSGSQGEQAAPSDGQSCA